MKYSNWSQVFANDPNSDSYDKNAVDVANLTIDTISAAKCIDNIKKEPNLVYLSVGPITKSVQIIHHLTAIGGNIAMPETIFVAISDFGASPLAVRLDPIFFDDTEQFKVPSWASITRVCQCRQRSNHHNQHQKSQTEVPSHHLPPTLLIQNSYRFHLKDYRRVNP